MLMEMRRLFDSDNVDEIGYWAKGHHTPEDIHGWLMQNRCVSLDHKIEICHTYGRYIQRMFWYSYPPGQGSFPITIWTWNQDSMHEMIAHYTDEPRVTPAVRYTYARFVPYRQDNGSRGMIIDYTSHPGPGAFPVTLVEER